MLAVPVYGDSQARLPVHHFAPPQLEELVRVDAVTQIVESAILYKGHHLGGVLVPQKTDQVLRHFDILALVGASDVVDGAHLAAEQHDLKGPGHVLHVQEIPGVLSRAVQSDFVAPHQLIDELGNELLGELVWAVNVVATCDDNRHVEGAVVRLGKEFCPCFGGGVWISWLENLYRNTVANVM